MQYDQEELLPITTGRTNWLGSSSKHWIWAICILVFGIVLRVVFFRDAFGSDELVYSTAALQILHGEWARSEYIGAIRYGINIPMALWIGLFGYGKLGLGGLFFGCSIAEIILTFAFARYIWGNSAALWSAAVVAALPLNVALAGSLNPDAYLALVIELSFIAFYFAQQKNSSVLYFLAGLLAGWVGWVKEAVALYVLVFFFLALAQRRWQAGQLWFVIGGLILLVSNLILFRLLTGDFLYVYHIFQSHLADDYLAKNTEDTSALTYFVFLFVKIYHTGLLGPLALAGAVAALRQPYDRDLRFVLIWGCGLLLAFSILPISFSPLKFVPKQTNYMLIFTMPLTLLAGWFLARQKLVAKIVLGGALLGSSILLSAMEQQAVHVVTANGKAASDFATRHSSVPVFGSETVERQSALYRLLKGSLDGRKDIHKLADMKDIAVRNGPPNDIVAYAIYDPQALYWAAGRKEPVTKNIRTCGSIGERLSDADDLGWGRPIVGALYRLTESLPLPFNDQFRRGFESIYTIAPATVYAITRDCVPRLVN